MKRSLLPLVLSGFILSGCMSTAPVYWQHKTIPSDQWQSDQRACKREAERYLGLDSQYHADAFGRTEYEESMRKFDVSKNMKKLVGSCMRKRGYVPVG